MEASQSVSTASTPGSLNPRLSSQGPDGVASAHPACSDPSQGLSPDIQHRLTPQSAYRRPLISTYGWDIKSIIARSPNFHPVQRVHYSAPNAKVEVVIPQVERDGNPLIIHGWNRHPRWPRSLFNIDWLRKNGDQNPTVRNVHNWADFKIPMDDFIKKLHESPAYASPDEQERLYGKDGDCPAAWTEWLLQSGAIPQDLLCDGSNDFLNFLPDKAKVQTLMCYMGVGDTFTPFHKDLCASSGQNLMCFSEHAGSAFWFMTKSSAAPQVAAYFHQLGQEVDLETHVVTIEELEKAPFDVYIAEQVMGDLVLVPPRSCHQVVNKGGITIKTSWSRMSLSGLQTALWHELPIYHRVCRQEIYKVKSNIFHALQHFTGLTEDLPECGSVFTTSTENLKQLVCLFDDILAGEFSISRDSMPHVSQSESPYADDLHCDFCGADIFQSFFECDSCLPATSSSASASIVPVGDGLVLCPSCYVEGRTCLCENMQPVQCRPFSGLLEIRDRAVKAIQRIDDCYTNVRGYLSEQPLQLLSGGGNIFEAACKLFQKQQIDTKAMRSCRRASHQVPAVAAIYCKSCHGSKCYTHLLELDSIHSVDAIILSDRYDGDANWHQTHRNSLQQYHVVQQRVIEDEARGSRSNVSHRLAYLAKTFTTCRAIAPEVTKHGWYDRFAQTTSTPIVNNPTKALISLPEEIDGNGQYDIDISNGSPSLTEPTAESSDLQMGFGGTLTSSTQLGGIDEAQLPHQSGLSDIPDPRSLVVNPTSPSPESGTLQPSGSPAGAGIQTEPDTPTNSPPLTLCSPSTARQPPAGSSFEDDPADLSDLTDLPTEGDSPYNSIVSLPDLETSNQRSSTEFTIPLASIPVAPADTQLVAGPKLRPRVVLDCVEIPHLGWYNRKIEMIPPSFRRKRKRAIVPSSSDIAGPSDSDTLPLVAQEISNRSSSKRTRKALQEQGPASRLLRSSKHAPSPLNNQNPPPTNNFLANALNQTFRLNSTSATSNVPTTPASSDAIPPVSNALIIPTTKPQYRDFGVQKELNFTRRTLTVQPSVDLSGCIVKLEAENRDLRAQAEKYKQECEAYRGSLEDINRWYYASGPHHRHLPPSGPSNFIPLPPESARWKARNTVSDGQLQSMHIREPDYPPIETLSPSSPEYAATPPRRQTPTEPRSFRTSKARGDGRMQPYFGPQQYGRRRGPIKPMNVRRRPGKLRGSPTLDHGGRSAGSPVPPHSPAAVEPGVSRTPQRSRDDEDQ